MRPNPPHPGEIIKSLCLEPVGLTVTEAAEGLGVSRKTLSAILNGRSGISPEMAIRLAETKIKYIDEPLGKVQVVPDFLPSPAELAFREEGVKVSRYAWLSVPANRQRRWRTQT